MTTIPCRLAVLNPLFQRPAFSRVRRVCLALPETTEATSWGHPNFRAGKKTFCAFEVVGGRPSIAFKLPPHEVDRLLRREHFFSTPYGRGRWVSRWMDAPANENLIARLLERSYRLVANKRMISALEAMRAAPPPAR